MLWLWRLHNGVSLRLQRDRERAAGTRAASGLGAAAMRAHRAALWPPEVVCPECWRGRVAAGACTSEADPLCWDEHAVLRYFETAYWDAAEWGALGEDGAAAATAATATRGNGRVGVQDGDLERTEQVRAALPGSAFDAQFGVSLSQSAAVRGARLQLGALALVLVAASWLARRRYSRQARRRGRDAGERAQRSRGRQNSASSSGGERVRRMQVQAATPI